MQCNATLNCSDNNATFKYLDNETKCTCLDDTTLEMFGPYLNVRTCNTEMHDSTEMFSFVHYNVRTTLNCSEAATLTIV